MEILRNPSVNSYLAGLGSRLATKAPGARQYRFRFEIVNDRSINAAGLPGGIVYIHRGAIEAAANEAQLAGVIAHEIGHIVLRHGSQQVSNAYVLQVPLSAIGRIGSKPVREVLSAIGGGFTASSIVLRNSLEAESHADIMGTQIVYDAGYDPRAAAAFFEKLDAESPDSTEAQLLDEHPTPEDRFDNVTREIERLGNPSPTALVDSPEFRAVRALISGLPAHQEGAAPPRLRPNGPRKP
jgi:predicted Zn-dependent protease